MKKNYAKLRIKKKLGGCFDQSFISGRKNRHWAFRFRHNIEIFFIFPSFLRY